MGSFLLESVVNGNQSGRYSFLGVHPDMEVVCKENDVAILDHLKGERRTLEQRLARGRRGRSACLLGRSGL